MTTVDVLLERACFALAISRGRATSINSALGALNNLGSPSKAAATASGDNKLMSESKRTLMAVCALASLSAN